MIPFGGKSLLVWKSSVSPLPKEGYIRIIEMTSWLAPTGTRAHFSVLGDSQRPCSTQGDHFLSGTVIMGLFMKLTKVRATIL